MKGSVCLFKAWKQRGYEMDGIGNRKAGIDSESAQRYTHVRLPGPAELKSAVIRADGIRLAI